MVSVKNVLCGLLVMGTYLHAAVQLQPFNPIKRIDGLNVSPLQKAGIKSVLGLVGTAGVGYFSQKIVGDGSGDMWYNNKNALMLSRIAFITSALLSASPIAHEINDDLGDIVDEVGQALPMLAVSGMLVNKGIMCSGKQSQINDAQQMAMVAGLSVVLKKGTDVLSNQIS